MSKISKLIFKNAEHYITSPYGYRNVIQTSAGSTSSFHSGVDYGTNNKKLAQYAIEDGYIMDASKASDGANYVWVIYPRCKLAMLHYHLDSYKVKAGQTVKQGTLLGYTGMTGKATGIHLHLGIKNLKSLSDSKIKKVTYNTLANYSYVDPETVSYSEGYTTGTYKVVGVDSFLNVRTGAGTSYSKKKFSKLTANAQAQIKKLNGGKAVDGLVNGCECTVTEVKGNWGKIPSGWISLDYCKKIS